MSEMELQQQAKPSARRGESESENCLAHNPVNVRETTHAEAVAEKTMRL